MDVDIYTYDYGEEYDPAEIAGPKDAPRRPRGHPRHIARKVPKPLGDHVGLVLIAFAHDVEGRYAEVLRPYRIGRHELGALAIIADFGGLSVLHLGERLGVSRSVASQLVGRLEREKYVVRSPHPRDRRRVQLDLTKVGHAKFLAATEAIYRADRECLATWSPDQRAWLARIIAPR